MTGITISLAIHTYDNNVISNIMMTFYTLLKDMNCFSLRHNVSTVRLHKDKAFIIPAGSNKEKVST